MINETRGICIGYGHEGERGMQFGAQTAHSVQCLDYRLDGRSSITGRDREEIFFPLRHRVQTGSGAHPASYSMDIWRGGGTT